MASVLKDVQTLIKDPSIPWQNLIIYVVLGVAMFEGWIGSRQRPFYSSKLYPNIPATLRPYLPSTQSTENYHKSQAYALSKARFGSILNTVDLLETYVLLFSFAAPLWTALGGSTPGQWTLLKGFWDLAGGMPGAGKGEIRQSMWFTAILMTIGGILSVPKEYWKAFVVEEKHGFNKMTKATFVKDQIKGYLLGLGLQVPLIAGVIKIIHWVGPDGMFKVVAWIMALILALQIIMIPAFPYLIAPLFNKFTPLEESSPVFPKIKELAEKLDFPLGRIWIMDGSTRSAHSNAFFFGLPLLTKHIVIYDTLLEKSTPEEIQAILAHELGHWKGMHVLILLSASLLQTSFSLTIFTLFLNNAQLLSAFGFNQGLISSLASKFSGSTQAGPTIVSLLLAATLFTPLSAVLQFATNGITRMLEYNADGFAVKLGESYAKNLKGALVRIHEDNKAIYGVDWIYSAYNNNHPTLIERLDALDSQLGIKAPREKSEVEKKGQ